MFFPSTFILRMWFRRFVSAVCVVATIAAFAFEAGPIWAAGRLTTLTDAITTHQVAVGSDHGVSFTTPTGVDSSTDTITLDFDGFTLSSITAADVDLSHGPTTGAETTEVLAATAGVNVWGVSISGDTLTLTAPTNAAIGEIAAGDRVNIVIGLASGGTNQITNPAVEGDYELDIAGTFNDEGYVGLAIGNDVVNVSATVPSTSTPATPGGGGGGTQPPLIFNVQASTTSFTTLLVTWQTDEFATSFVDYGHDIVYTSGTVSDLTFVPNHSVNVNGLIPCATYHFRVRSNDVDGNSASSGDYMVTMPCDTVPPVISNVQAVNITDTSAIITWNTNESADSVVEYGLTSAYGSTGTSAGFVTGHAIPLSGLVPGATYHYRVISTDPSGNRSVSADFTFTTTSDTSAPANVQLTATPGHTQIQLTWTLPSDADFSGVRLVRKLGGYPTGPNDGTAVYQGPASSFLDTGLTNGVTYYYGAYAYDTNGNMSSGSLASATPFATPVVEPPEEPPIVPFPPGTVPPGPGVTSTPPTPGVTMNVQLFGSNGALPLAFGSDGTIGVLAGSQITVRVPADSLNGTPTLVAFMVNGTRYALTYDDRLNAYVGTFIAPLNPGLYGGMGQVIFDDGRSGAVGVVLRTQRAGRVYEKPLIGDEIPIEGAKVRLFRFDTQAVPWDGSAFGQANPLYTDAEGRYVFEVPPGRYYIGVEKEGFWTYFSPPMFVDGNVFALSIELVRRPPTPDDVVSATSTPTENAVAVVKNLGDQLAAGLKLIRQFLNSSVARDIAGNVVTPLALTLTLINAMSAIPLFNALAYLQYLFTEPLFLFGRRRRRWGVVYNAYTKHPIDLAIVRLIHTPSGLTVGTRVTDTQGRYFFVVAAGQYRIEVVKPGYVFPSQYLKGKTTDADFSRLYFGDRMLLEQRTTLTPNIPVDPLVPAETSRQALLYAALHRLQHVVAASGVMLSGIVLILFPSWTVFCILLIHTGLYLFFRRLHGAHRPPSWGLVSDKKTRKPLPKAVVRLFESKFNRLLETQVTDRSGRYGFLASKNAYYLTAEAKGYRAERVEADMTKKDDQTISKNIPLERNNRRRVTPDSDHPGSDVSSS